MKKYLPILLLFFLSGIDRLACVASPATEDYLTRDGSVPILGVLWEYPDLTTQLPGRNVDLPCTLSHRRENYEAWLEEGSTAYACETNSDSGGIFSLNLVLPVAGLYRFSFNQPQVLATLNVPLLTYRPDLTPTGDQPVYFDWTTDEDRNLEALGNAFLATMDASRFDIGTASALAFLAEVETERQVEAKYDPVRVTVVEEAGSNVQTMLMRSCDGEITSQGCWDNGFSNFGLCTLDYRNTDRNDETCEVYVPKLTTEFNCDYYLAGILNINAEEEENCHYLNRQDPSWVRVGDVGRALSTTAAHELAHGLGLVDRTRLYGSAEVEGEYESPDHNPTQPSFVGALRHIPMEIVQGSSASAYLAHLEDCSPLSRNLRDPDAPVVRCPRRFNSFNRQYLQILE